MVNALVEKEKAQRLWLDVGLFGSSFLATLDTAVHR